MSRQDFDFAIVGAGVVGLAVAAETAALGHSVVVMERHDGFGQETSSRNSEVVHAGLYYPSNWLKARLCVEGRHRLYELAERYGVAYRKCGKVIVATTAVELASLEELATAGQENGVAGLRLVDGVELRRLEPHVRAQAALLSPETGIVDSHGLMACFLGLARDRGAIAVFSVDVLALRRERGLWRVDYAEPTGRGSATARVVINAAGLGADAVALMAGVDTGALGIRQHMCKGEYFALSVAPGAGVRGLVYPSPDADRVGLGIHSVVDLGGGIRLGPNAFYVDRVDYTVDGSHAAAFHAAVTEFLPFLRLTDLAPAMAGIRPKLAGPGEAARDFFIGHMDRAGAPGLIHLAGIESPGLTASPAIARLVAALAVEALDA